MPYVVPTTVLLRQTDAAGLVFFPRLLEMAQDAYERFSEEGGASLRERLAQAGPILPIAHCEADYLAPMRLGDSVAIEISLAREGERSFTLAYRFLGDDGREFARAQTVHVALDRESGRAVTLPDEIRGLLARLQPASG